MKKRYYLFALTIMGLCPITLFAQYARLTPRQADGSYYVQIGLKELLSKKSLPQVIIDKTTGGEILEIVNVPSAAIEQLCPRQGEKDEIQTLLRVRLNEAPNKDATYTAHIRGFTVIAKEAPPTGECLKETESSSQSHKLNKQLGIAKELNVRLMTNPVGLCSEGLTLILSSSLYAEEDWDRVNDWLSLAAKNPSQVGTIKIAEGADPLKTPKIARVIITPHQLEPTTDPALKIEVNPRLCLIPQGGLPSGKFNTEVEFNAEIQEKPLPPGLNQRIAGFDLAGKNVVLVPTSADAKLAIEEKPVPGKRSLDNTFDLGLSYTRAKNKEKEIVRRGILDLRVVPIKRIEFTFGASDNWLPYYTPFYLDANVSTGKIVEETLSLNRVLFGTKLEIHYVPTDSIGTYHRFILRGTNASDRDYKQAEFVAAFEYSPVFNKLNRTRQNRGEFRNITIQKDPSNPEQKYVDAVLGWSVIPTAGVEIGKTYLRRNPAEAIKPTDVIRRFFVKLELKFDISKYVSLSVSDEFYVRGEDIDNRTRNLFSGTLELPISTPFLGSKQALFINFKRGNEPPFATPDVNAFILGYRLRSNR